MAGEITMGKLVYRIIGDNVELKKAINDSEQVINRFGKGVNEIAAGLRTAGKVMTGIGTVMVGALSAVVVKTAEAAGEIDDLAKRSGISRERLQELGYAAKQNGSSIEGLAVALGQLSRNMLDAANDTGEAKDVLKALNVSLVDSQGSLRNSSDVLLDVADRFSQMTNETEMTAVAMRLFGRSGAELVPFLREGREGIERLSQEARELGFVLGEEAVKDLEAFGDEMDAVKTGFAGVGRQIAVALLPYARDLLDGLKNLVKWFNDLPESMRKGMAVVAALGGALALVTGPMLLIIGYIPQIVAGFGMIAGALTPVMIAGTVVAALAAIVAALIQAKTEAQILSKSLREITEIRGAQAQLRALEERLGALESKRKTLEATLGMRQGMYVGPAPEAEQIAAVEREIADVKSRIAALRRGIAMTEALGDSVTTSGKQLAGVGEEVRKVLEEMDKALAAAAEKEKLLGDRFDLNVEKAKIYSSAIDELIKLGVKASDPKLQDIFRKWMGVETDEQAKAVAEAIIKMNKSLATAAEKERLLGDQFDLNAAKADIFKTALEDLLAAGLKASDPKVQEIYKKWITVQPDAVEEALKILRDYANRQYQALLAEQNEYRRKESQENEERIRAAAKAEEEAQNALWALRQKAEREALAVLREDNQQYEEWKRKEASKTADQLIAESQRCVEEELQHYIERLEAAAEVYAAMGDEGVETYGRILAALANLRERDLKYRAEQIQKAGETQRAIELEGKRLAEQEQRRREETIKQWTTDLITIQLKQSQEANKILAEDNRQLEQYKRNLANETATTLIAEAERCKDEELKVYLERLDTVITFYQALTDMGEKEAQTYGRLLVARSRLAEKDAAYRAKEIQEATLTQLKIQKEGRELEEREQRRREEDIKQWLADLAALQIKQSQEVNKVLADDNRQLEEYKRKVANETATTLIAEAERCRDEELKTYLERLDTVIAFYQAMEAMGEKETETYARLLMARAKLAEKDLAYRAKQIQEAGETQRLIEREGRDLAEQQERLRQATMEEWADHWAALQIKQARDTNEALARENQAYEQARRDQAKKTADELISQAEKCADAEIDLMITKLEAALITYREMGDEGVESYARILVTLNELKARQQESVGYHRWKVEQQYGLERNFTEWQKQEIAKRLQAELAALDMSVEANRVRAEAIKGILADLSATMPTLEQMTASWGQTLIDGLSRAIAYGENLGDVFKNLLRQIAEWFIKYRILMPLLGPLFGFGGGALAAVGGGAMGSGILFPGGLIAYHAGGEITDALASYMRSLAPPIYAHQGLRVDEVPIIAQTGERVLSRTQNDAFERLLSEPRQVQVEMHIHAVDAASFASLAQRNPEAITSVVIRNIQSNGEIRRVLLGR